MPEDDERPKRPDSPALDDTIAPGPRTPALDDTIAPGPRTPALEDTLAAGSNEAAYPMIRPPRPITETVGADSSSAIPIQEQRIDRYMLQRRLGAGGMGIVYCATDTELNRGVAIKVIKSGASADRLKREAQALARLDHPNVVTVYDVGEHDGRVFVAMELVDGASLQGWLHQGGRTLDEIMHVLMQAAKGIIAAHTAGLIHRDLKPENIFVANDGAVRVGDFGLARDAADDEDTGFDTNLASMSLTQTGHVLGTPAYMAPEQAEGVATERSDQFSFCVTAYEALYGTRPFVGTTFQEILDRVDSQSLEAPKQRRKVPRTVARAIRRGLAADPAKRFRSMKELVAAMQLDHKPRWPWLAGGVAVTAAVIAVVAATREPRDAAEACATRGTAAAAAWTAERRAKLVAHLRTRAFNENATAEIAKRLDEYSARWATARRESCLADARGELDARSIAARSMCESLALVLFEDTIQSFETNAHNDPISAAKFASSLPPIERCAGDDAVKLAVTSAEHQPLMREILMMRTADLPQFAPLRARAEAADDLPAQLELALTEAARAKELHSYAAAETALQRGMPLAEQLDASAARAHLLALAAETRCAQGKDPEHYLRMAEAAGKRLDATHNALEHTSVLQARATCLVRGADPAAAIPVLEELVAQIQGYATIDLDELVPRADLALAYRRTGRTADAAKQDALVREILARYTEDTSILAHEAAGHSSAAFLAGDLHSAISHQQRAIPLFTQQIHQGQAHGTLAMYFDVLADWKTAAATHAKTIELIAALPASDLNDAILAEAYAFGGWDRLYLDDVDGARSDLEKALPIATRLDKTELVAIAQLGLGRVWLARKEYARAIRTLQDGLTTHAKLGDAAQFRVAMGLFALARAQWELGDKYSSRITAQKAEVAATKGLDQAREHVLGAFGMPFKQSKVDEIVGWREAHK